MGILCSVLFEIRIFATAGFVPPDDNVYIKLSLKILIMSYVHGVLVYL